MRRYAALLALVLALTLAACGSDGKSGTSGGSPAGAQICTVNQSVARVPGLVDAIFKGGYTVGLTAEEVPTQTAAKARRIVADATAGSPGTQSGGTNTAGGDTSTTINNFCGRDSAFGAGSSQGNTSNTTTGSTP